MRSRLVKAGEDYNWVERFHVNGRIGVRNLLIPRECVEAIQRAADRRAARIIQKHCHNRSWYEGDDVRAASEEILHRPKPRRESEERGK